MRVHAPRAAAATSVVPTRSLLAVAPRRRRRPSFPASPLAMFTGIVQGTAVVASVDRPAPGVAALMLRFPSGALANVPIGGSIAVNGTCLTVVSTDDDTARFDVVDETLRVTTLGGLATGDAVNFERSAKVGDEIGGHMVSGHVATTADVARVHRLADGNVSLTFAVPAPWGRFILPKGFVAVHGVSLTVGDPVTRTADGGASFSVYLIPETLRVTVLGALKEGDRVNIEVDAGTQAVVAAVDAVLADGGRLAALIDERVEAAVRRALAK